jgi:hypothetical protein
MYHYRTARNQQLPRIAPLINMHRWAFNISITRSSVRLRWPPRTMRPRWRSVRSTLLEQCAMRRSHAWRIIGHRTSTWWKYEPACVGSSDCQRPYSSRRGHYAAAVSSGFLACASPSMTPAPAIPRLAIFRAFPFDKVKIDRGFIADLDGFSSKEIVRSSLELRRSLGISVVAEGVETPKQLEILRKPGCDLVQGFLVSRPQPIHPFRAVVRRPAGRALAA